MLTGKTGGAVDRYKLPAGIKARLPFSGSEKNSVFRQGSDGVFSNVSGVSGLDSVSDGRTIAFLDYDRDGFLDVIATNANQPTLDIFRNQVGQIGGNNKSVFVKLIGGNTTEAKSELATRDGVGALIRVTTGELTQSREVRKGEGLATQSSSHHHFGLNDHEAAKKIVVRWPSGQESIVEDIPAGSLVTVYEVASEAKNESGFELTPYRRASTRVVIKTPPRSPEFPIEVDRNDDSFKVISSMATWCPNCKNHLPEFELLERRFDGQVETYAVSIDFKDTPKKLAQYVEDNSPAYELLPRSLENAAGFTQFLVDQLGRGGLPFSVVLSPEGEVVLVKDGLPTVSELKKVIGARPGSTK